MSQIERATPDELEARYNVVRDKIGMGLEQRHFVRWAIEETDWNVSERQLRKYYKAVTEQMQKEVTDQTRSPVEDYVRHMERLDFLYRESVSKGDTKTALAVAKEYADFRDLKNPENQIDWKAFAREKGLPTNAEEWFDRIERLASEDMEYEKATNNG